MAQCGNCKKSLSCSCKVRKAKDGKSCCTSCIASYEKTTVQSSDNTARPSSGTAGIIGVTITQKN